MMSDIKRIAEEYWVSRLNEADLGVTFYASKADDSNDPPIGVVICSEVPEILPGTGVFKIDSVQILLISSIDDQTSDGQATLFNAIVNAINAVPQRDQVDGFQSFGRTAMNITDGTDEEEEKYADVVEFSMGCAVLPS